MIKKKKGKGSRGWGGMNKTERAIEAARRRAVAAAKARPGSPVIEVAETSPYRMGDALEFELHHDHLKRNPLLERVRELTGDVHAEIETVMLRIEHLQLDISRATDALVLLRSLAERLSGEPDSAANSAVNTNPTKENKAA